MNKISHKKINKHGFTLAELLVVIAILSILAGVSFVGVSKYIRRLQQLEMDNTAKDIFIAAQNHLSQSYASGEYGIKYENDQDEKDIFGFNLSSKPSYLHVDYDSSGSKTPDYKYVLYKGSDGTGTESEWIHSIMLPVFSIDSEVAENGNYLIAYEANTATVLGVFYSSKPHTSLGNSDIIYEFDSYDEDRLNAAVLDEDLEDPKVIGCYIAGYSDGSNDSSGGSNPLIPIPEDQFKPLRVYLTNEDKLTATIINLNYSASNQKERITLTVTGLTSGNKQTILVKGSDPKGNTVYINGGNPTGRYDDKKYNIVSDNENITITLDDITTISTLESNHFGDLFPYLIPGEDIEVQAEYSEDGKLAASVVSNTDTDNSLFYSYGGNEADIKYIRHLENLDPDISKFDFTELIDAGSSSDELTAIQIEHITYNAAVYPAIYDINSNDKGGYYGIHNDYLVEYDGTKKHISNIVSNGGNGGNSGIIGTVNHKSYKSFKMKNLEIINSNFKASTGNAGSAVGAASTPITLENISVKNDDANPGSAITISSAMEGVYGAGGLIGNSTNSLNVKKSYVSSDNLTISGIASGGIAGSTAGSCTIEDSHVEGQNLKVSGTTAGGAAGRTSGKLDITDTYSTAYVYADAASGSGGGIAGGFIGSVNDATTDSIIERCYVSGHTKNGNYGTGTSTTAEPDSMKDNYNVISNGISGGFIGDATWEGTGKITVKNSYTTASVYSSDASNGIVGGFVGTCVNLSVDNVYSAGLVSVTDGGSAGGFLGVGTASASGSNYYLRGLYTDNINGEKHEFNNISIVGSGNISGTGVTATSGEGILATSNVKEDAWDKYIKDHYQYYTYKTVKQLSGASTKTPLTTHIGDWAIIEEDKSQHGIFIRNAEKLALVIKGNEFKNNYLWVLVEEKDNTAHDYYANYYLDNNNIELINTDFCDYSKTNFNYNIINNNNTSYNNEYYLFFDDITKPKGAFHNIFPCIKEGADIQITAIMLGSQNKNYTKAQLKKLQSDTNSEAFVGITNSLFADGSFNSNSKYDDSSNYYETNYYSDINPNYAIVKPIESIDGNNSDTSYSKTALITNFRHLQNLDDEVSNIKCGMDVEKVKLCKDLYWKASTTYNGETVNQMPVMTNVDDENYEYYNNFITAINDDNGTSDQEVKIYKWNETGTTNTNTTPLAAESSFYGIKRDEHYKLVEFDGQGHSINNLVIKSKTASSDMGLFRSVDFACNKTFTMGNFKMNYPVVIGTTGEIGTVIGKVTSDHTLTFNVSNIEINYPTVESTTGDVGGMIGKINVTTNNHTYNLTGITMNYPNVTGNTCNAAGGVIGRIIADTGLTFNASKINTLGSKVNVTSGSVASIFGEIYIENGKNNTGFTIENITTKDSTVITGNQYAGVLIGRLGGSNYEEKNACDSNIDISKCLLEDFAVVTRGYSISMAGSLFGGYYNKGSLKVDRVYSYGKNSLIKALGSYADAGGLIGDAYFGKYEITNTGASAYVYAGRSAGGFIGEYKPTNNTVTSKIENCFVGGHVSKSTFDYLDSVATDVKGYSTDIIGHGGYNIWSKSNSGGFIGYIFTNVSNVFKDCFTTASVGIEGKKVEDPNNEADIGTKSGGFIGYLQFSPGTVFNNCYVAGCVFNKANHVGGFTGINFVKTRTDRPTYNNVSVLRGINYNDNLIAIDVDEKNGATPYTTEFSESIFVEPESSRVVNTNTSEVRTSTFNLPENSVYPFKDEARNPDLTDSYQYVFYGDWVEPKSKYVSLENGNRLTAVIDLSNGTTYKRVEDINVTGGYYYETYIKLQGEESGVTAYYRVRYNEQGYKNIAQISHYNTYAETESTMVRDTTMFDYHPDSALLEFYIDNLSSKQSNYLMTMSEGPEDAKPGENIIVNVRSTYANVQNVTGNTQAMANSLFEKRVDNSDGTCTVYISNSRNLQNLESSVSGLNYSTYKITKAVQTDNIYWKDDGSYIADANHTFYTAKVEPYITELSTLNNDHEVIIYNYNSKNTTDGYVELTHNGKFKPIYVNDSCSLTEYDGGGYSIYNLSPDEHLTSEVNSGLLARTNNNFTVKNLTLINPTVVNTGDEYAGKEPLTSGAIVGTANKNLTLSNVHLKGITTVTAKTSAGGFVGEVSGNLVVENCGVNNFTTYDNRVTGELNVSCSGGNPRNIAGMVAKANNRTQITGCTIDCNSLSITDSDTIGGSYLGGFIAFNYGGVEITSSKIDSASINISSNSGSSTPGGLVAYSYGGDVTLNNSYINSTILKIEGGSQVGGILALQNGDRQYKCEFNNVGITSPNGIIKNVRSYSAGKNTTVLGGLIGSASLTITNLQNCYTSVYLQGYSESVGGLIGSINSMSGVISNCYVSGHTKGGVFVDTIDESVDGRFNIISCGKHVGGFIGSLAGTCTVEHCFNTNSLLFYPDSADSTYDDTIGGFIGVIGGDASGELRINDCYSYSHVAGMNYSSGIASSVGTFAGQLYHEGSYHNATINNSYYLDEGIGLYPIVTKDGCEVGLAPVTKTDSANITATNETFSTNTVPFDASRTTVVYPFKNWISSKTFYGDWME
ncbi:type II secretion system protein [Oribacterium sp. FC2011]|uniref:type II secretion system protein n=1 Tax=Oribacterium sp. FC2011 TaxID=1408311 RepID=UPI0004E105AB|nr:type II secretion system protein [Oribacterium sp. FC2011]